MLTKHVVCTNRNTFLAYSTYWENSGLDFEYLVDTTSGILIPDHKFISYDQATVRNDFSFTAEVSKQHYWNPFGNRNIIWFYAHLRMAWYWLHHPGYDFYWFYDDDLTVADWNPLHSAYEKNDTDFISYYVFKEQSVESQPNIPQIDNNTSSGNNWFNRFPGPGDILPSNTTELFGSFFPIVRLSSKALSLLTNLLKEGVYGYSEGFVPTILNYHNYTLDTFFDSNSNSKYFDNSKVQVKHKNDFINWAWI